jgi:hypothetical protein
VNEAEPRTIAIVERERDAMTAALSRLQQEQEKLSKIIAAEGPYERKTTKHARKKKVVRKFRTEFREIQQLSRAICGMGKSLTAKERELADLRLAAKKAMPTTERLDDLLKVQVPA